MFTSSQKYFMASILIISCFLSLPFCAFSDVQPLVDQINGLPENERNHRLLEGAKKDGVVNWYTDMQPRNAEAIVKMLSERHPFLKVEVVRLGHERLINRITTEYRAGKFIPDVITAPSSFVNELKGWNDYAKHRSIQEIRTARPRRYRGLDQCGLNNVLHNVL